MPETPPAAPGTCRNRTAPLVTPTRTTALEGCVRFLTNSVRKSLVRHSSCSALLLLGQIPHVLELKLHPPLTLAAVIVTLLQMYLADSDSGSSQCYGLNVRGDEFGNCGSSQLDYRSCDSENLECGQLQCGDGEFTNPDVAAALRILTFRFSMETCKSFTARPSSDTLSPGLVADGTRCSGNATVSKPGI